ncbi:magnesium-dependent phosphatase-1 [Aeropyrum camini]|uniref:Predicted phosphatase n=1 Tax=Aeropyrum camini SY1 = JCM 12091 TaxID=1198449 RepID=U3TAN7_9CREN|nr:magnesium-dependent phosphatase-1 [Aeropyrum camini]BAN89481.1 predicted phosphatase [Aeropyrum camini SY1 = JCM 12091]
MENKWRNRWLLLLDLDGTLWDHLDVSSLNPPFSRVCHDIIVDSSGVEVRLYSYMIALGLWARRTGGVVSSLSWNVPFKALEALRAFGVAHIFHYHVIEPHPWKGRMLAKLLRLLRVERRLYLTPDRIVYFDDREIHLDDIRESVGEVNYIKSHVGCRGLRECSRLVQSLLKTGGEG